MQCPCRDCAYRLWGGAQKTIRSQKSVGRERTTEEIIWIERGPGAQWEPTTKSRTRNFSSVCPPGSVYDRPHQPLRPLHTGAAISHSDEEKIAMAAAEAGCQEESSRSTQTAHRRVNARETNQSIRDLSWVRRRTHLSRGADRIPIRARRQTMWSCRRLRIGMVEDGIHCASAACISSTGRSPG